MIPTPGIYADIPDKEYFSWQAVSQSALKTILKSPAEYLYRQQKAREPSTEMTVGSALDALVTRSQTGNTLLSFSEAEVILANLKFAFETEAEPYKTIREFHSEPEGEIDAFFLARGFALETEQDPNRRSKEYQTWKKEQLAANRSILVRSVIYADPGINRQEQAYQTWKKAQIAAGKEVMTFEDLEAAVAMYEAVATHPEASILLTDQVEPQASIVWADPETGILCKGRIDATSTDGSTLHDLKTTRENHPQGFAKSIAEYGYHFQAACYLEGIQVASEGAIAPENFCLHAVRNSPVYCVESYKFGANSLYIGREEFHRALRILKECQETDTWPATTGRLHPIDLPGYYHQVKGDRWANLEWEVSP